MILCTTKTIQTFKILTLSILIIGSITMSILNGPSTVNFPTGRWFEDATFVIMILLIPLWFYLLVKSILVTIILRKKDRSNSFLKKVVSIMSFNFKSQDNILFLTNLDTVEKVHTYLSNKKLWPYIIKTIIFGLIFVLYVFWVFIGGFGVLVTSSEKFKDIPKYKIFIAWILTGVIPAVFIVTTIVRYSFIFVIKHRKELSEDLREVKLYKRYLLLSLRFFSLRRLSRNLYSLK
ncbi:Uncharacterised protein [Mycoplasmopsis columboralis]|uniref:Uncharacterized protein n=3 Tax=Mycoplasmopsis columboralis TaxID=171282 RepID=A0A449B713_9BACT|nr:Uncharacterised protein [Mycoplasmopsis columboralis]